MKDLYFKFLSEDLIYDDCKFKLGMNSFFEKEFSLDIRKNIKKQIKYTDIDNILEFKEKYSDLSILAIIKIPSDEYIIYCYPGVYISYKIEILEFIPYWKFLENPEIYKDIKLKSKNLRNYYEFNLNPSREIILNELESNPEKIKYVRDQDIEMCNRVLSANPRLINYVRENKTLNLEDVIEKNPLSIRYLFNPDEKKILSALKSDGSLLQFFPNSTYEMKVEALKNNGKSLSLINHKDENYIQLCLYAVKQNGMVLKTIPEDKLNDEIIREALKQNHEALRFVKNQTEEFCNIALEKDGSAIKYISNQNVKFCMKSYEKSPENIKFFHDYILKEMVSKTIHLL